MRIGNPWLVWLPRGKWEERRPLFPPITVLLSLGRGTPCHEYHSITQPQQREISIKQNRGLFVNMKNQNLKKGRKVVYGGVVRSRVCGLVSARQVDTRAWGWR